MAYILRTPAPTFIYRAHFPRTDEYIESPDFHTLYKSAFRLVQTDDNGEHADCVIYKIAGEITALNDYGGFDWRVYPEADKKIVYNICTTPNNERVYVRRYTGKSTNIRTRFSFKARPFHYDRKAVE